jgi:hypothetical protein
VDDELSDVDAEFANSIVSSFSSSLEDLTSKMEDTRVKVRSCPCFPEFASDFGLQAYIIRG